MEFLAVPLGASIVALWIVLHYVTRWRTAKTLTGEDEKMLQELWQSAARMEERIRTLERILDAEVEGWREKT